jgi:type II secretory pathway pseudopilin PulG
MGALLRGTALTLIGMVATYAMKKMMASVQKQADSARQYAEAQRDTAQPKELKTLKLDPKTGVYYAED